MHKGAHPRVSQIYSVETALPNTNHHPQQEKVGPSNDWAGERVSAPTTAKLQPAKQTTGFKII